MVSFRWKRAFDHLKSSAFPQTFRVIEFPGMSPINSVNASGRNSARALRKRRIHDLTWLHDVVIIDYRM